MRALTHAEFEEKERKEQIREQRIDAALDELDEAFASIAGGPIAFTYAHIRMLGRTDLRKFLNHYIKIKGGNKTIKAAARKYLAATEEE